MCYSKATNTIFECQRFNEEIKYFDFEWLEKIITYDEYKAFDLCLEYQKLLPYCQVSDHPIKPDEFRELIKMKHFI